MKSCVIEPRMAPPSEIVRAGEVMITYKQVPSSKWDGRVVTAGRPAILEHNGNNHQSVCDSATPVSEQPSCRTGYRGFGERTPRCAARGHRPRARGAWSSRLVGAAAI